LYFALHVLFVSHETFCFYQTVYIFIYSAYKLQVCSLNFCVQYSITRRYLVQLLTSSSGDNETDSAFKDYYPEPGRHVLVCWDDRQEYLLLCMCADSYTCLWWCMSMYIFFLCWFTFLSFYQVAGE